MSGERNFIEQIKAQILLEAVLAAEIYNVRAPIQVTRERQPQHFKTIFP